MNARPTFFLPASEEADLIVSRWQRQSLEVAMDRLCGISPSQEESDEDAAPDPTAPRIPTADDEYAWASALGREED